MTYIRDLVTHDHQAEFRNDVQLSHYDDPEINLGLIKSFIFSPSAPKGKVSGVDLLEKLCASFNITRQNASDNRLVCIANYGHGKSHLALVLANYFSQPLDSKELEQVFNKLSNAVENTSKVQRLRDFRQDKGEFLVIRLRGDENAGLREQLTEQIQIALKEHTATKNIHLSFWSDKALELLERLTLDQKQKADQYLEKWDTDLARLKDDVRNHRELGYDRTRELWQHLTGALPDLGGEVKINKLIKDIGTTYCGEGKPLAGMVILFDEFSLFIQRYAQRRSAGELQELLNGVENLGNKAVFLAFSQHDPITVAKNYVENAEQLQTLEHELTRIPVTGKLFLYSLIESVINAYLRQPKAAWDAFASDRQAKVPLARASSVAMMLFHKRYEDELRWGPEEFDAMVTRGAFPLHPLTTTMLCNLDFSGAESIGNPRTLLGFIREQVTIHQDDPVFDNGKINWILPIFLVDYFKEYLGKDPFKVYDLAVNKLPTEAPPEQARLLKALLLQSVSGLKLPREDQLSFLGEAAGIPHNDTLTHLTALVNTECIHKDENKHTYAFWSLNIDPENLKKLLQKRLAGQSITKELVENFSKEELKTIPVSVKWGHSKDWEAKEILVTREFFTTTYLREQFPISRINSHGEVEDGVRGGLVWLIPESSEDVVWFQQHTEEILDQAFPGEFPLPVVIKTTSRPYPNLLKSYQVIKALEAMSEEERKEAGLEYYEYERGQKIEGIQRDMISLRGESENYSTIPHKLKNYIVPAAYRIHLRLSQNPSVSVVMEECYRLAYPFSPPEFYINYQSNNTNLKKATRSLATSLFHNNIGGNIQLLSSDRIALDILQKFLYGKWHLVTTNYGIRESDNGNITRAWTLLEGTFQPGVRNIYVRDTLIELINSPYGYDKNTLTLLFSAWVGYHQHDLQFASMGLPISVSDLASYLAELPGKRTFIDEICGSKKVSISRRDSGELIREVRELIDRTNKETFTQTQAKEIVAKLKAHSKDVGLPSEICTAAQNAAERADAALKTALEYDEAAKAIQNEIDNGKDVQAFIQLKKRISDLPRPELVMPLQNSVTRLDTAWREGLQKKIDYECDLLTNVSRLQDVGLNENKLQTLKNQLTSAKLDKQVDRVKKALVDLSSREAELKLQESESPIQAEITAMAKSVPLVNLYAYIQRLQSLHGYSEATLTLCNTRSQEIQREIKQLEDMAEGLISQIDQIDSNKLVVEWKNQFLRISSRYEGSKFQDPLENALLKVNQIESFLAELSEIEKKPTNSLDDIVQVANVLEDLYTKNKSWLSVNLAKKTREIQGNLSYNAQQKTTQAHEWLMRVENLYTKNESLERVIREINTSQPYLLSSDRLQLEQLKSKVQRKLEEDALTRIEMEFRKINDLSLKRECVNRLQNILKES